MSHNISVVVCEDYVFNSLDIEEFNASDYFPDDFKIQNYSIGGSARGSKNLIGIKAHDWTLQTADKALFSLDDLKGKVAMIQFTSVSCGPCKVSIPFLKKLSTTYSKEDFDFVAIECATKNTNALKSYMHRNDFDYKFLLSDKEVLKNYAIRSFPVFFILDENRIIRNVIYGYGEGSTDQKIIQLIEEMI
jgi:thiol-disulfide isomerase/thioredoxin